MTLTFNPLNVFAQTYPRSNSVNSFRNKVNVTFAYSNPILVRNRSEGKFSTKSYKNKKFPHFKSKDFL